MASEGGRKGGRVGHPWVAGGLWGRGEGNVRSVAGAGSGPIMTVSRRYGWIGREPTGKIGNRGTGAGRTHGG
jgi:hypothetical protein